jgi:hypothetical protein
METEYILVSVRPEWLDSNNGKLETFDETRVRFECLVSAKLREGWTPIGGVSIVSDGDFQYYRITQALTRKKKTD